MEPCAKVEIVGRLGATTSRRGRAPVLRYTAAGRAFFGVFLIVGVGARSTWIEVEIWDRAAEVAAEKAKMGDWLRLLGRIAYREWTDHGKDRRALIVVADEVSFIERPLPPATPDPRVGRDG